VTGQTPDTSLVWERQQLLAELRSRVARESDALADSTRQLAGRLAEIPRDKLDLAAVRNVENLAYSTDKVSDLTDLLKKLIGRDGRGERWAREGVGPSLLNALEGLRDRATRIADTMQKYQRAYQEYESDLPRRIHLLLCREYVRHLVANFEYLRLEGELAHREFLRPAGEVA